MEWIETPALENADSTEFAVSRPGTLSAAIVRTPGIKFFSVVSMYSFWTKPHASTGSSWIISDASAHRLVSDLSALFGQQTGHRILAAGDLNILHGHGEHGSQYWASRYGTVFSRMEALGLKFGGPKHPMDGRQTHGRMSCPQKARMCPPTIRLAAAH